MNRKFWLLRGLRFFFFGAVFVAVATYFTMSLWNWLVPALFGGPLIGFAQTLGLLVLSRILFGGWGRGGRPGAWAARRRAWRQHMQGKWEGLTPEQRENLRQQMRQRCTGAWGRRPAEATQTAAAPAAQ